MKGVYLCRASAPFFNTHPQLKKSSNEATATYHYRHALDTVAFEAPCNDKDIGN
jgi:hypothetical protein